MNFQTTDLQAVGSWVGRLLRLDLSVFDEIRGESSATLGALIVVFGASLFAGLGSWLWALQSSNLRGVDGTEVFIKSLLLGSIIQTMVWFLWVYLTYQILVRAYGVRTGFADLARVMGFAFAPVALNILIAITGLAVPFGVIAFTLAVLLTNIAIQHASDAEAREAIVANISGFAAFAVIMGLFANIAEVGTFGGLAPGIFFFSLDL